MSATKEDGLGGPLGELLRELPEPAIDAPREPVHTRVLPLSTPTGAEFVFACWRDPGGAQALHAALRARVEGSLLGELSRTAEDLAEGESKLAGLRLVLFADVPGANEAVRAFGFVPVDGRDGISRAAIARLRHEAETFGEQIPEAPVGVYEARAVTNPLAARVEEQLVAMTGDVFGRNPGAPFARLARALAACDGPRLKGDLPSLDALEGALFGDTSGVLRWLPPLTFQALSDMTALCIAGVGRKVDWAEAASNTDGVAPPPMIRLDGAIHVPIALEVLRWCVMPRQPGEEVPPLSEWVEKSFG